MGHQYPFLDNPVWHALETVHGEFALGGDGVKRYPPDVLRMFGCAAPAAADLDEINAFTMPGEKLFLVGELTLVPNGWELSRRIEGVQMVCSGLIPPAQSQAGIVKLTEADRPAMLELTNLVQPGYYHINTPALGNYYGIKQNGQLVAMAGERFKLPGFTEVSAVGTHPAFTGKGYAQQLVAHVAAEIIMQGNVPFLHFVTTNGRARKVYELLGFEQRRLINFSEFVKK